MGVSSVTMFWLLFGVFLLSCTAEESEPCQSLTSLQQCNTCLSKNGQPVSVDTAVLCDSWIFPLSLGAPRLFLLWTAFSADSTATESDATSPLFWAKFVAAPHLAHMDKSNTDNWILRFSFYVLVAADVALILVVLRAAMVITRMGRDNDVLDNQNLYWTEILQLAFGAPTAAVTAPCVLTYLIVTLFGTFYSSAGAHQSMLVFQTSYLLPVLSIINLTANLSTLRFIQVRARGEDKYPLKQKKNA